MAVQGLVAESPLLSCVYDIVDVRSFARTLGSPRSWPGSPSRCARQCHCCRPSALRSPRCSLP